ncbi:hypothetical protein [Prolixibacter sp. NT017]|uniref:hypothetical protein n=1 Tax=Prolixibacter sp. NT017 TaxID=2652390 RepID=UPI0012737DD5|nr:hypothetical protein [Prolixibacter sp. NT017]GET25306.1 hypothetical protein NT017_16350 [Prolixibacter sp. NT017]
MPGGLRINLCNAYGVKISLVAMLSYNSVCPTGNGYKQIGADTYRQKQSGAFADKRAAGGEKNNAVTLAVGTWLAFQFAALRRRFFASHVAPGYTRRY